MFSKEKKARARAAGKPSGKNGGGLSFIGSEVVVNGDIVTEARLHVDGRIEGNVRCGMLSQGESGTIAGNIVTEEARLAGLVDGTVTAQRLILGPTARITGDVSYEILSIEPGARIDGRFARREGAATAAPKLVVAAEKAKLPSPLEQNAGDHRAAAAG
ncbi:bactofilin family protein [Allosphingosinicella sp.]|uniref:bactofilin family protein n=1 Tax=Allosphingosinicella sp. TaxID=2823234 RepID=UPI002FC1218C